jgi:hypothetical protein
MDEDARRLCLAFLLFGDRSLFIDAIRGLDSTYMFQMLQ